MATYFLLIEPGRQFLDSNGDPLAGGKLTTYEAGTTTEKSTYKDNAGAATHTNPIILDSAGRTPTTYAVWGTTGDYKLKLDDSADANIWTIDDVTGVNDTGTVSTSEWVTYGSTATFATTTTFTLAGDQTTEFHVGRRLRINDASTLYATITATLYSDPNTTVTVVVDGGTNLTTSMTGTTVSYGVISNTNTSAPVGAFHDTAFRVHKSADQTSITASTWTDISFDTETGSYSIDVNGNFSTPNYTAPATGTYFFSWSVISATASGDGDLLQSRLYHTTDAGLTSGNSHGRTGAGVTMATDGTAILYLDKDDQVKLQAWHDVGTWTADADSVNIGKSYFAGVRIA